MKTWIKHITQSWRRDESGTTAVEFVILLPVMMIVFGTIVDGARIYWNYQSTVSGVRDASRYIARISNNDACVTGGLPANAATLANGIIRDTMQYHNETNNNNAGAIDATSSGAKLFPTAVTLSTTTPVTATLACINVSNATTTVGVVPVVRVDATVEIALPLSILWSWYSSLTGFNGTLTSTITDQSRVYGL